MCLVAGVWFSGCGGCSQGLHAIPGVCMGWAANHSKIAVSSHQANFPDVEHMLGDIRDLPVWEWPDVDIHQASPECTNWTVAKGVARLDGRQPMLIDTRSEAEKEAAALAERSRALMEEVPYYLEGVISRGKLVKAGIVENVVEARSSQKWGWWMETFRRLGYRTKLIAYNSMHAQGTRTPMAPQSRDRLYFAYWHESLGRDPDWDKWIRPAAWCPSCGEMVDAVQVWRVPGVDMGRYKQSYDFRCPKKSCRGQLVEPHALPAAAAIDWSNLGPRIGDRPKTKAKPEGLVPNTIRRIKVGLERYCEPFITELRGGGSTARPVSQSLSVVATSGNHHFLTTPPGLLVPYYGNSAARPVTVPVGALSTRDRYALATPAVDIADVRYRMLTIPEIAKAMAFTDGYVVLGKDHEQKQQYGDAVTPCVIELIGSALVETITGEPLERLVLAA